MTIVWHLSALCGKYSLYSHSCLIFNFEIIRILRWVRSTLPNVLWNYLFFWLCFKNQAHSLTPCVFDFVIHLEMVNVANYHNLARIHLWTGKIACKIGFKGIPGWLILFAKENLWITARLYLRHPGESHQTRYLTSHICKKDLLQLNIWSFICS